MMTISDDKTLLELAAKAAGIEIVGLVDIMIVQPDHRTGGFIIRNDRGGDSCWNPLTDDGDALRLAVKLKMEVYHGNDEGEAVYASYVKPNSAIAYCVEYYDDLSHKGNSYAATRRAIVRAAAKTGESM